MDESQKPKVVGARRHRPECLCKFCLKIRENIAKAQTNPQKSVKPSQVKQEAFIKAYTDVSNPETLGNPKGAAVAAGYKESAASRVAQNLLNSDKVQNAVVACLERAGVDGDLIAGKVREGLDATVVWRASHKGELGAERTDPDFHVRQKYLDMALRVRGDYPKDEPVQQAALILKIGSGPVSPEEWEVIATRERARKVGPQGPADEG